MTAEEFLDQKDFEPDEGIPDYNVITSKPLIINL